MINAWSVSPMATDIQVGRIKSPPPLMDAVLRGRKRLLDDLVAAGEPLDTQNTYGWNALITAAAHGHEEFVLKLLEAGANRDLTDCRGWDAARYAHTRTHVEIFNLLRPEEAFDEITYDDDEDDEPLIDMISPGDENLGVVLSTLFDEEDEEDEDEIDGWDDEPEMDPAVETWFDAINSSEIKTITSALKEDISVDVRNNEGQTALHVATLNCDEDVVRFLVSAGADINALDEEREMSPLMLAAEEGETDIATLLLELGANPDFADDDGITALMVAAQRNQESIANLLIARGADINKENGSGNTALHVAVHKEHDELSAMLIEQGADWEKDGFCVGDAALCAGLLATVTTCVSRGFDKDAAEIRIKKATEEQAKQVLEKAGDRQALALAILKGGSRELIEALIEVGAPVNVVSPQGWTPLLVCELHGRRDISKVLIDAGANISLKTQDGVGVIGAFANCDEIPEPNHLKYLIDSGATVEGETTPILHPLLKERTIEEDDDDGIVIASIQLGGNDDDEQDEQHRDELDQALADCIQVLIKAGADVDETDPELPTGVTPLVRAVENSWPLTTAALLEAGANPDPRFEDEFHRRLIHIATSRGNAEVLSQLLEKGVDPNPNKRVGKGIPAICLAAINGDLGIVSTLLDHGADPNCIMVIDDVRSSYPLLSACKHGNVKVAEALLEHGSKMDMDVGSEPGPLALVLSQPDEPELESRPDTVLGGIPILHYVLQDKQLALVKLLLKHGADANGTFDNQSMLKIAIESDFAEAIEILCAHGAQVSGDPSDDQTPLQYATQLGHVASVHALISAGAALDSVHLDDKSHGKSQTLEDNAIDRLLTHMSQNF